MKASEKRKAGEHLGRERIALNIIKLASDIASGSYKNAIIKAGMICEFVEACAFDEYWSEKAMIGRRQQQEMFESLNEGFELDPVKIVEEPVLIPGTRERPKGQRLCKCDNGINYTFDELADITGKRAPALYERYRRSGFEAVKLY